MELFRLNTMFRKYFESVREADATLRSWGPLHYAFMVVGATALNRVYQK